MSDSYGDGSGWDQSSDLNQGGKVASYGSDGTYLGMQPAGLRSVRDPGAPLNLTPPAADPNAGAGWKQTFQNIAKTIGNWAGGMQVNNGQLGARPQQQQPAGQQQPASANPQGGPAQSALLARAQALLQRGVISQAQYQQILNGSSPIGMAAPGVSPVYNPPSAPPTGPTSPAWGG